MTGIIDRVKVRSATLPDDDGIQVVDYSTLNAVSTCPRFALVRYGHHRIMGKNAGRAMALEAGQAAHEAYAAARLWQLWQVQGLEQHAKHWGYKLLGEETYENMLGAIDERETQRNQMLSYCLEAFYSSGFYDDPEDKRRTVTTIEEALIAYLDRFNFKRDVWVHTITDHKKLVGVELPIDIVIEFHMHDKSIIKVRYVGRADGLHWHDDTLHVHENKTASRLNDAWSMSFWTSHQVTGYCVGISHLIGQPVNKAVIHGMAIPLPRSFDFGGIVEERVGRTNKQVQEWFAWILHNAMILRNYMQRPLEAPMFTGSCNKYFRPCSLIPLCATHDIDETQEVFNEMEENVWDPLKNHQDAQTDDDD